MFPVALEENNPDDVMLMSLGLSQLGHGDNKFTTETHT